MEPHDDQEHPGASGLEHISTEELLKRLREANKEPSPTNKQSLSEYINDQKEIEDRTNTGGDDTPSDPGQ